MSNNTGSIIGDVTTSSIKSIYFKDHFKKYLNVDKKQHIEKKVQARASR